MLAADTGQPVETIAADCRALRHFTPDEARTYGLIDRVLPKKLANVDG
jgi:ATP-dependent protease ClpP protease subunit